jgi:hypothetical protein
VEGGNPFPQLIKNDYTSNNRQVQLAEQKITKRENLVSNKSKIQLTTIKKRAKNHCTESK